MISINSNTALMLYLSLTLSFLLLFWLKSHFKLKSKKVVIEKEALFVCEFCHFAYLADRSKKVTKCPGCGSFNKDNRY